MKTTEHLIINSPYEKPTRHLKYIREIRKFQLVEGRRPAGYVVASESSRSFDDPGNFIELPLVNRIRERVDNWRDAGYPGITGITRDLLEHWKNPERERKFFFCQLEAIETLIWLLEAPESEKQGIEVPGDGGALQRLCCKMATGSGKTIVMAMLAAWQILNKVAYPKDTRFSRHILIVAPGLTVKSRLQVLQPSEKDYYQEFDIVPSAHFDKLRQGKVKIINWHALSPIDPLAGPRVVKKGPESNEAFTRRVLEDFASAKNIMVINDEAHHAWRINPEARGKYLRRRDLKDSAIEATIWIDGLDRIHKTRNILKCFDFSATPFYPSGGQVSEDVLFGWIVSDFGLNDAIESGLVKTPRVAVRDEGKLTREMKSRFYHIYNDPTVKTDLNRQAEPQELLPDIVVNAYYFLGKDWLETYRLWKKSGVKVPPVMITVCNRVETSARVEYAFNKGKIKIDELQNSKKTLRIDSKALEEAEGVEEIQATPEGETRAESKKEKSERLRKTVDTIGKVGEPGEQIQNVISVGMLSEGWDAKTVTHIMGLRAFTSQLLCEQVVGRGLRRTEYDVDPQTGLFRPEYVNIFGVPFTFLPHEGGEDTPPPPPKPTTRIYVDNEKSEHEITWPNVIRINHVYTPVLSLDIAKVKRLELRPEDTPLRAELAPIVEGKPDITKLTEIDIEKLSKRMRKQRIIFETAKEVFEQMQPTWTGNKEYLLIQLIKIVEEFLYSNKLVIKSKTFQEDKKRRLLILLNMTKIVQHLFNALRFENTEQLVPIFDKENPLRSTSKMITWFSSRPCEIATKSHISHVVFDSSWEASEAFELDRNKDVISWVKNDHLGFVINYVYRGAIHRFYPDFLIKLSNGKMLVLEVKGKDDQQNKIKREYLDEWIKAVKADGRFGEWTWDVSFRTSDIRDKIKKHSS